MEILYYQSTNLIELIGLQDVVSGSYVNGATVKATILDHAGNALAGETWPVTLSYVTDSDGDYRGTVSKDLTTVISDKVRIQIVADDTGASGLYRTFTADAEVRG